MRDTRIRWRRRTLRIGLAAVGAVVLAIGGSLAWSYIASGGHRYDVADAPTAPVVIVLGAKLQNDRPMPFLAGRLDVTAELVRAGKAKVVLVSGDAAGTSGNETKAMTEYLTAKGVDPRMIVVDPYGVDTYDTCARAIQVYGIDRALLVTQSYHLPRAVALCRNLGIEADGVAATCDCTVFSLAKNRVREWLATVAAVPEAIRNRSPAVASTPDGSVLDLVGGHPAGGG
ncbi:vancomycin permeability regulator SanA [Kibdelosporangium banguiense]|uniref:Vancomycin permeability regulator SanA n=1 Tax=Kibdelosporangium banguiense TaxID=1365924 RepID=A0ABS4U2U1_9PSEU|nr:ElyC/SanA/YdcF family protein [Kibdelosporangium banguiense]MBP2330978.1 vancomycin permeability regulator SanA [Kibdelosporangium banguiense]